MSGSFSDGKTWASHKKYVAGKRGGRESQNLVFESLSLRKNMLGQMIQSNGSLMELRSKVQENLWADEVKHLFDEKDDFSRETSMVGTLEFFLFFGMELNIL